jgi:hypothetical protein
MTLLKIRVAKMKKGERELKLSKELKKLSIVIYLPSNIYFALYRNIK